MILAALDKKGGVKYLVELAGSHPQAFVSLLGRTLPLAVEGGDPKKPIVQRIELVAGGNGTD